MQVRDERDLAAVSCPDERRGYMQRDGSESLFREPLPSSRQEPTVGRWLLIHATCDVIKAGGQGPVIVLINLCMLLFSTQIRQNNPGIPRCFC